MTVVASVQSVDRTPLGMYAVVAVLFVVVLGMFCVLGVVSWGRFLGWLDAREARRMAGDYFEATLDRMWRSLRAPDRYWTPHGGWYRSTRSVAAHCWDAGHPLCQDSDPGKPIWHGRHDPAIGRICEDCRVVLKARLLHRMRLANPHRREQHATAGQVRHG